MNKNTPSYTLKSDGRIIEVRMAKEQHPESLAALKEELTKLNIDRKQDILVDMSALNSPDTETREAAEFFFGSLPYRRCALCCGTPPVNLSTKELIGSSSKSGRIKIFRRREDARAWLKEG